MKHRIAILIVLCSLLSATLVHAIAEPSASASCEGDTLIVSWANANQINDWSSAFSSGVSITVNGSSSNFDAANGSTSYAGPNTFDVVVVDNSSSATLVNTTLTCGSPIVPPPPPPAPIIEEIVCLEVPQHTVLVDVNNCAIINPMTDGDAGSTAPAATLPTDFFKTVNVYTQIINGVTTLVVTDIDGNELDVYGMDDLNTNEGTNLTSEAGSSNGDNRVCIDETITQKNRYTGEEETIRRRLCITSFNPLVFTTYTYTEDNINR
ncbi:MAG: hypothetical protein H7Y09_11435 [Chitinophagaceae bacterium]|nr:hypothetical protein [Anaerolineae bacterium]